MSPKTFACQWLRLALAAALLTGCAGQPLVSERLSPGRRLVLLFDASTSMRENDPAGVARLGGQLVMGLVGSDDNVGAITYSATATVQRSMGPVGGEPSRAELSRILRSVERNGITNFAAALDEARAMLEASQAPPGSPIVLLTDGVPYRGRRREVGVSLGEVVEALRAKGWPIYAIALSEEAQSPFLSLLVGKTGGAVYPVADAGGLLAAFQAVATEALGYLRAERGRHRLTLGPDTRRLAFVARWPGGAVGRLLDLAHDGTPLPAERIVRTPGGEGPLAVGLIEHPAPGSWEVRFSGEPSVVALVEPTFALDFVEGSPPERVDSLARVEVAVRLVAAPGAAEALANRVRVRGRLEVDGKPWGEGFDFSPDSAGELRFRAAFRAPRVEEESSLRLVVDALLPEGSLTRTRSLTVRPGSATGLALDIRPGRVERAAWAGRAVALEFSVQGDPRQPVEVRCGAARLDLEPGARGVLRVSTRSSGALEVRALGEDGAEFVQRIPVTLRRFRVRGAQQKGLVLQPVPVGFASEPVALSLRLIPAGTLAVSDGVVRGPGGARLPVRVDEGRVWVEPDPTLPPGHYEGGLPVRIAEHPEAGAARLPVRVEVLPKLELPESVTLRGRWGWVTTPVELAWPAKRAVPIRVEVAPLVGSGSAAGARILPRFDVRVRPLDGWKGDRLGVTPRRLALEVFLAADLPQGTYRGALKLIPREGERDPLVVPLDLTVKR
ncbi:MAG: VWA domain-containing protein [Planctomycetota bacterium]|nr:MAG: VWA domain-containing protein [Planctomycetota bacterium]